MRSVISPLMLFTFPYVHSIWRVFHVVHHSVVCTFVSVCSFSLMQMYGRIEPVLQNSRPLREDITASRSYVGDQLPCPCCVLSFRTLHLPSFV